MYLSNFLLQNGIGYLKIDNLTDVFCYVSAILVVVDMDSCSLDTGLRRPWQWELGAFTLTVTWLNLLSLLLWHLCCDFH